MNIQPGTFIALGVFLLALVTVEYGGHFITLVSRGKAPANELQKSFFRAGHGHAAVLLVLSFAVLSVIDATPLQGVWSFIGHVFVPAAAILMPAGFFFAVIGRDPQKPNRFIWLLWAGAIVLAIGLVTDGVGLIVAGATR